MIYALEILESKFVKIGFSEFDVDSRISTLQTGSPFKINKLFVIEGSLLQEKQIHKALTDMFTRIRIPIPPNEWYPGRNEPFKKFLEALAEGANTALFFLDKYNQSVKQPGKGKSSLDKSIKWPTLSRRDYFD